MRQPLHVFLSLTLPLTLALALTACGKEEDDPNRLVASGHVEATDVRISTEVGGRLEALSVREGDVVRAGQVLARVETTDTELAIDQAQAERDQAEAELRLRLAGARPEEIDQARAEVERSRAELDGAQKDLDRMQGLLDRGSGTPKSRDDARTRRDMAAAGLRARQEGLDRLRAGSRPQEIDAARARVAAVDARLAQLRQKAGDATVDSPLAGVITEKLAQQGELLQPGSPLCVITDLANAWVTVYVPGPELARLRIGQTAQVVTDDGQTRDGRITFIASQAEFTPKNVQTRDERVKLVYEVKVGLDNRDGLFKPGMPAEARLDLSAPQADRSAGR
jgi:HlyD family secretion protein